MQSYKSEDSGINLSEMLNYELTMVLVVYWSIVSLTGGNSVVLYLYANNGYRLA